MHRVAVKLDIEFAGADIVSAHKIGDFVLAVIVGVVGGTIPVGDGLIYGECELRITSLVVELSYLKCNPTRHLCYELDFGHNEGELLCVNLIVEFDILLRELAKWASRLRGYLQRSDKCGLEVFVFGGLVVVAATCKDCEKSEE